MGLGLPVLIVYTFPCFRSLFFGALFLLSTFAVKAVSVRYRRGGGPANNGGRLSQASPPQQCLLCCIILARMEVWLVRERNGVCTDTIEGEILLL